MKRSREEEREKETGTQYREEQLQRSLRAEKGMKQRKEKWAL
jgi:hypothetical protein